MSRNGDDFSYDMDKDGLHHGTPIWCSPFDKLNHVSKKDIFKDKKCDEKNVYLMFYAKEWQLPML